MFVIKHRLAPDEFRAVKTTVERLYTTETTLLDLLADIIKKDNCLKAMFKKVRKSLRAANKKKWEVVSKQFYTDLVRSVMPDGTFVSGGDRR